MKWELETSMQLFLQLYLLMFIICFPAISVAEKWIAPTKVGTATYYADEDSLRTDGKYVFWSQLVNFEDPPEPQVASYVETYKGNCRNEYIQLRKIVFYDKPMARGKKTVREFTDETGPWDIYNTRSFHGANLSYACYKFGLSK